MPLDDRSLRIRSLSVFGDTKVVAGRIYYCDHENRSVIAGVTLDYFGNHIDGKWHVMAASMIVFPWKDVVLPDNMQNCRVDQLLTYNQDEINSLMKK